MVVLRDNDDVRSPEKHAWCRCAHANQNPNFVLFFNFPITSTLSQVLYLMKWCPGCPGSTNTNLFQQVYTGMGQKVLIQIIYDCNAKVLRDVNMNIILIWGGIINVLNILFLVLLTFLRKDKLYAFDNTLSIKQYSCRSIKKKKN